jgi:hypothetical protein
MFGRPKPPDALDSNKLQKRYSQGPQNFATGNRVYNGSAPLPHAVGGLNQSGFNKRDQQARAKKDFLSKQLKSGGF